MHSQCSCLRVLNAGQEGQAVTGAMPFWHMGGFEMEGTSTLHLLRAVELTMRFESTTKVPAKCVPKYCRIL